MTAAVVLAASESTRTPNQNDPLSPVDGVAILVRGVTTILRAGSSNVIVVTGHVGSHVLRALSDNAIRFTHSANYRNDMSTSLRVDILSIDPDSTNRP